MADWFVDLTGSAGAGNGNSFANRSSDLAGIFNGASSGDVVRVKETPFASIGTCAWTKDGTIALPANTTKDLYLDGVWTAATNVTCTINTTASQRKQGASATNIVFASGFTTGRAAYYDLGSSQDFSGYTKVSFWMRTTVVIADLSIYNIALCSDATGTTVVNTLTLPAYNIGNNALLPITIDNGGALGSSIRSIALYTTADPGIPSLVIDNVFATNDLTLNSLIGKNTGDECWHSCRSVTNIGGSNIAELDQGVASAANTASKGYPGTSESVTTYVSDGFFSTPGAAATTVIYNLAKAGVSLSGGWATADMATQTGFTHINGRNLLGRMFQPSLGTNSFDHLIISHVQNGFVTASNDNSITDCHFSAIWAAGVSSSGTRSGLYLTRVRSSSCANGVSVLAVRQTVVDDCVTQLTSGDAFNVSGNFSSVLNTSAENCVASGIYSSGGASFTVQSAFCRRCAYGLEIINLIGGVFRDCTFQDNSTGGVYLLTCEATFYDLTTSGNGAGGGTAILDAGAAGALVQLFNWSKTEATAVSALNDYDGNRYISVNEDGTAGNHIIRTDGGTILAQTTTRHTASGIAWELQPFSSARVAAYPLTQNLKGVPVKAGVSHTVSLWARRSNTGLTLNFGIANQGTTGIAAAEVSMTAAADTWEQLSLSFTPTVDCVVDFYVAVYGGTTYSGFWDDFAVSAASALDTNAGDYAYVSNGVYLSNAPAAAAGGGETSHVFIS